MIEIHKNWEYAREACDCCEGWWLESYTAFIDGVSVTEVPVREYDELIPLILNKLGHEVKLEFEEEPL